jgi:hypothetical protein
VAEDVTGGVYAPDVGVAAVGFGRVSEVVVAADATGTV